MTTSPVDQLSLALDATGAVIARIGPEQWIAPTPCAGWSVADLVSHLVTGNHAFAASVGGGPPPAASLPDSDLAGAYLDSAASVLSAFAQPGALERVVTVPFGTVPGMVALHLRITEVLVHGWDLARATGQPAELPEDLAEAELSFNRPRLADIPADRRPFAPPQPVAAEAPAIDRLAACLGRAVTA